MALTDEQMLATIKDTIEQNKIAVFMKGRVAPREATTLSHIGSDLFFDRGWNIHPVALPARREQEDSFFLRTLRRDGIAV